MTNARQMHIHASCTSSYVWYCVVRIIYITHYANAYSSDNMPHRSSEVADTSEPIATKVCTSDLYACVSERLQCQVRYWGHKVVMHSGVI